MERKKIAVVSTDGVNVDEHFGRADHFLIYDRDAPLTLVEKRKTEIWSVGDPNHSFDGEKFGRLTTLLQDCCKVYMTRIGAFPAAKLKEIGIEPVIYKGKIADIAV